MGQNDCISCRPLQTVTMLSMKQITLFVAVLACSLVAASAETRKLMQGTYPSLFPILDPAAFGGLQNSVEGLVGNVANPFPDYQDQAFLSLGLSWTRLGVDSSGQVLTSLSAKQLLFSPSLGKRARSIAAGVYCSKSHEGVELLGVGIALR